MRIMPDEFGERLEIKLLRGMLQAVVTLHFPTAMPRNGEESAMLARAVVIDALFRMPFDHGCRSACFVSRMVRTTRQRILVKPNAGQPSRSQLSVKRFAAMRSAGQRKVPCAQRMRLICAGLYKGYRLHRLQRRARISHYLDVTPSRDDFACCIGDSGGADMHAFNQRAAPDFDHFHE